MQQVWLLVFAAHAALAASWWWLMPGGFPPSRSEYWVNQVAPVVPLVLVALAMFSRGALREAVLAPIIAMFALFWMALGISARLTFPDSAGAWNILFGGGFVLAMLWARQFRFRVARPLLLPVFLLPGLWAGWAFPATQRAGEPTTQPAGVALAEMASEGASYKLIKLSKDAQAHPEDGRVVVRRGELILTVQALPGIGARSPDRCWADLAPPEANLPVPRKLVATQRDGARWRLRYKDEAESTVEVGAQDGGVQLEARSRLPAAVFVHQSRLAEITLRGHKKLGVSFSPLPGRRFEPAAPGAPARFAYLDQAGVFHVAEASTHDRGPFTDLGSAAWRRTEPLVVTLHDGDAPAFQVTLDDWGAQASTELSPTAGFGLPVNAIQLEKGGDQDSAPAALTFTLASTSIGRGSRTVGLAAGVYRDRIGIASPRP
jgi:hypothetical protein